MTSLRLTCPGSPHSVSSRTISSAEPDPLPGAADVACKCDTPSQVTRDATHVWLAACVQRPRGMHARHVEHRRAVTAPPVAVCPAGCVRRLPSQAPRSRARLLVAGQSAS
jgi:hypothetical protein